MNRDTVLIVDDEPSLLEVLSAGLGEAFQTLTADSVRAAGVVLDESRVDLVLTDLKLPDGSGLDVLSMARARSPDAGVIVLTAHGTTDSAVAAMKAGAVDFLTKPFDLDELRIRAAAAVAEGRLRRENHALRAQIAAPRSTNEMLGTSSAILELRKTIRAVAPLVSTVLITGESGTGKELVARALHRESPRSKALFVSVNCAAVPETLLESELFGHVRGAFTDARASRAGLFETAHRGTLFLDEIAEMSLEMQAKLLRVLQERTIRPVGGSRELPVDVRIVAATNKRLEDQVSSGRFREDLYFRLNVIPIVVPPLRDRVDDIGLLATVFCERFAKTMNRPVIGISAAAMEVLRRRPWRGNVRELENSIERAVALETSNVVLPERFEIPRPRTEEVPDEIPAIPLPAYLEQAEARITQAAMERFKGRRGYVAEILGISPRTLRYLLKKHAIK